MKKLGFLFLSFVQLIVIVSLLTGCASFKSWIGENISENVPFVAPEPGIRYSDAPQAGSVQERQYKHMTKAKMEDESELSSSAGSLWQMEGQTSYMFAQNKSRREGDTIAVKLDAPAMKQVETKVTNIKTLLKELEQEENRRKKNQSFDVPMAEAKPADAKDGAARAPAAAAKVEKPKEEKIDLADVENIQSKIIEKMPDGNYRIKGSQPFMIEKKEYKVIISGLIKPEDFNDAGISSAKLIDPQYDVVSIRRAIKDEAIY